MKMKDLLPFLLIGGAYYAWQNGLFHEIAGATGPPLLGGGPAIPPEGGPVFGPAPTPVSPPVVTVTPVSPPPVAAPPVYTAPPLASTSPAQQLIAAGGAAPKNVWEWNYYVQQLGLPLTQRDPWGVLGDSIADIQAVKFTAPEYLAYLQGAGGTAGLAALACACVARSTRI